MSRLAILNKEGAQAEEIDLPEKVFEGRVNTAVLHQAVVMYQASLRQGNASTKERGSVSGGGKKPYRQKGTGRARAGSNRSPLWQGGGVVFGPHPRDFGYTLPKKIRRASLREAVQAKYQDGHLVCVTDLTDEILKTRDFAKILKTLSLEGKILALLDGAHETVQRASRNIRGFHILRAQDVTAYDILRHKTLFVTKTAFNRLLDRMTK